jgi:hypothetical protein
MLCSLCSEIESSFHHAYAGQAIMLWSLAWWVTSYNLIASFKNEITMDTCYVSRELIDIITNQSSQEGTSYLPRFVEALIGLKQGQTHRFDLKFPQTWQ